MQMQNTFSMPNGSVPGWTPAMQLQPVVQSAQTVHATQIQPALQHTQTQVMVVHPSNQIQYQLHMNQAGWTNPQPNTAQMAMACETWAPEKKVNTNVDWCRQNQEKVRLQQQYQLLHTEYEAALIQIQTLSLQHKELEKKLKMDQWKYQELNNKYVLDMQTEQKKYNALSNMHTETCIQLRNEKGNCNALSIKLEESKKSLMNEQQKYGVLSRIHAETKKILHSVRQKSDEVVTIVNKNSKIGGHDQYDAKNPALLRERPVKSTPGKPYLEYIPASHSITHDPIKVAAVKSYSERCNQLVSPPGF